MEPPAHRPYERWLLWPALSVQKGAVGFNEAATIPFILEQLSTHSEIQSVGRRRFQGTIAQKNALYFHFRNFTRQAISNFRSAQMVTNRSAALLYYYAALNFAKAELIDAHADRLVNSGIGHGLSFNPTNAKTVFGDYLTVRAGVFPMLYERRTGIPIENGTKLNVRRLLLQVPEIAGQVANIGGGQSHASGILQMLAQDRTHSWMLIAMTDDQPFIDRSVTSRLFQRHFHRVKTPDAWRDHFGMSRRHPGGFAFYESIEKVPVTLNGGYSPESFDLMDPIASLMGERSTEDVDAWLVPSLYKTKFLPMPPSLARYALTYYASSLVRYKPQMFDSQAFPEQAHLFDAIARELALPMLQDILSAVEGKPLLFFSSGSLRS